MTQYCCKPESNCLARGGVWQVFSTHIPRTMRLRSTHLDLIQQLCGISLGYRPSSVPVMTYYNHKQPLKYRWLLTTWISQGVSTTIWFRRWRIQKAPCPHPKTCWSSKMVMTHENGNVRTREWESVEGRHQDLVRWNACWCRWRDECWAWKVCYRERLHFRWSGNHHKMKSPGNDLLFV